MNNFVRAIERFEDLISIEAAVVVIELIVSVSIGSTLFLVGAGVQLACSLAFLVLVCLWSRALGALEYVPQLWIWVACNIASVVMQVWLVGR